MTFHIEPQSCRTCLQTGVKLRSMYMVQEDDDEPPIKMIEDLTGICIEALDTDLELPKKICKNCELSLNLAYQFRLKALQSHDMLMKFHKTSNPSKNNDNLVYIKDESNSIGSEDLLQSTGECRESEDSVDSEESRRFGNNRIILTAAKRSVTDVNRQEEFVDRDSESDEEDEDESEPTQNFYEEDMTVEHLLDIDEEYLEESLDVSGMEDNYASKEEESFQKETSHMDDYEQLTNEMNQNIDNDCNSQPGEYYEEIIDFKEKKIVNYICEVCGNVFPSRARMMEHRKRHFPNNLFTCEICGNGFNMQEKLRKHMFTHSGQKPYKCSYCSRTFFYKSVKNNHEAVHKGAKPYVCEVCNRAFAYQHSLTKHKLIHDDIKLYNCGYCNKDFRLLHHYKQHQETRRHRNNVHIAYINNSIPAEYSDEPEPKDIVVGD